MLIWGHLFLTKYCDIRGKALTDSYNDSWHTNDTDTFNAFLCFCFLLITYCRHITPSKNTRQFSSNDTFAHILPPIHYYAFQPILAHGLIEGLDFLSVITTGRGCLELVSLNAALCTWNQRWADQLATGVELIRLMPLCTVRVTNVGPTNGQRV